jgi:hypothetical protein
VGANMHYVDVITNHSLTREKRFQQRLRETKTGFKVFKGNKVFKFLDKHLSQNGQLKKVVQDAYAKGDVEKLENLGVAVEVLSA